jgi:paraquat-inducible protein B
MSKPINPIAVGSFTLGALALLVICLLVFGDGKLFNADKIRYVIFFDSSLHGLEIGAPVKMQGVKIGNVIEIDLRVDPTTGNVLKPVVVEIDRKNLQGPDGKALPNHFSSAGPQQGRDSLVAAGFRARLELQSLLTGLLYIDFDKFPDKPAQFFKVDYKGLLELPSVPTTVDEIRDTAEEVVKKIRKLPLDDIVNNLADTLKAVRELVGSEEAKRTNAALAKSLEGVEKTIATLNQNLGPLLKETGKTVSNANALMQDSRAIVQDVHRDVKPILASTEKALNTANTALAKAQSTLGTMEETIGPDSALEETLSALKDTARSVKDLTDYLERHPESLIAGKNH